MTLQETLQIISDKLEFAKKEKVMVFLNRCIKTSPETQKSTYALYDNVHLKMNVLFDELSKFLNDIPKKNRLLIGVNSLLIIFQELGLEIEKEDAFLLYQLCGKGKFRTKDKELLGGLKKLWKEFPDFELTDQEFSYTLKALMRMGIIEYRRGNLNLKQGILISYKNSNRA